MEQSNSKKTSYRNIYYTIYNISDWQPSMNTQSGDLIRPRQLPVTILLSYFIAPQADHSYSRRLLHVQDLLYQQHLPFSRHTFHYFQFSSPLQDRFPYLAVAGASCCIQLICLYPLDLLTAGRRDFYSDFPKGYHLPVTFYDLAL